MAKASYAGMTTLERLVSAGLLEEFDRAGKERKVDKMVHLLVKVEIDPDEAQSIANKVLSDPKKFGY